MPQTMKAWTKPCAGCGKKISKPSQMSYSQWQKRKFCGKPCADQHRSKPRVRPLQERFEEKYMPEPNTGCWLWAACGAADGYGQMKAGGRMEKAHRVSWALHRGPIPDGLHVLHRCDTPACVNPDHLFLGTHQDNMRDRTIKHRYMKSRGLTRISVQRKNNKERCRARYLKRKARFTRVTLETGFKA